MRWQTWMWSALAALAVAASTACNRSSGGDSKSAEQKAEEERRRQAVPVEVAALARGPIETILKTSSHLEAEAEVRVHARTANRVVELRVEEGDRVAAGDLLVRLEDHEQKTQVARTEVKLTQARQELERQKALFAENLISEQAFKDIQFEVRTAELAFDDARRALDYTEVRAPIGGTVTRRMVKIGDMVTLNAHLFDLIDFDSIVARVYLPERNLSQIRAGQSVRVTANARPDRQFEGHILRIAPIVESKTGTVKVTVAFKDTRDLRPGMYVDVEVLLATNPAALLIPKRALVYDGDQVYVYRLLQKRRVERVLVEPRLSDRLSIEPSTGFKEGDEVVVAGQTGLKDGSRVRLPQDPDPSDTKGDFKG